MNAKSFLKVMEKAIIYVRRSTDVQEASLEDQRKSIQDYAQQNQYSIVREFCDDAISGKTVDARPGFQSLIDFARKNQNGGHTLLVYDVSRFGRFENPKEATYWEFELERHGVKVHYVTEGLSNDGSLGSYITKVVKDAEASEYIKKLSKLTKRGMRSCAERGYWISSQAPYGYQRAIVDPVTGTIEQKLARGERRAVRGKRIKLVPGEQEKIDVIKQIFDLYANHEQGLRSIADYLNRNKVSNPSGKNYWHKSTLRNILRNPAYIGTLALHKKEDTPSISTENAHEPIISKDLYQRTQDRLNAEKFGKRGGYKTSYLLTALVECAQCGNNLHGATDSTKSRRGYRCSGYLCKGKSVCQSPYYTAELLEQPVLSYIKEQVKRPDWKSIVQQGLDFALGEDQKNLEHRLSNARGDYEQNKKRMKNLLEAISDGLPRDTAIKAVKELEITNESLEEAILKTEGEQTQRTHYQTQAEQLYQTGINFDSTYDSLTPQEKKKIVKTFLAKATINHNQNTIAYQFYTIPYVAGTKSPTTNEVSVTIERKKKSRQIKEAQLNDPPPPAALKTLNPLEKTEEPPRQQRTLF